MEPMGDELRSHRREHDDDARGASFGRATIFSSLSSLRVSTGVVDSSSSSRFTRYAMCFVAAPWRRTTILFNQSNFIHRTDTSSHRHTIAPTHHRTDTSSRTCSSSSRFRVPASRSASRSVASISLDRALLARSDTSDTSGPTDRPTDRASERPTDRPSDRATERATERASERASERPSDRAAERESGRSHGAPEATANPAQTSAKKECAARDTTLGESIVSSVVCRLSVCPSVGAHRGHDGVRACTGSCTGCQGVEQRNRHFASTRSR